MTFIELFHDKYHTKYTKLNHVTRKNFGKNYKAFRKLCLHFNLCNRLILKYR